MRSTRPPAARLFSSADTLRDHAAFVVQAPAGFGKTSLLAQWRREYPAMGMAVAWLCAQTCGDPRRLVQSLALAVRVAAGRPAFGRSLLSAWRSAPAQLRFSLDETLQLVQADSAPASTATPRPGCMR